MSNLKNSKIYSKVVTDIALKRKGIKAEKESELTKKNWKVLIENAGGDRTIAELSVEGYFNGNGSEALEEYLGE